jgi:hypothetical protein
LSLNIVAPPLLVRAQPSGTLAEKPAPLGAYGTKTWVSGMSPAGVVSFVGGASDPLEEPAAPADAELEEDDEEPQPTAARLRAATPVARTTGRRFIGAPDGRRDMTRPP